jgi:Hsp70 protein
MSVVGIDLGFQNSVIAAAGRGGVDVILNGNSNRLNPYVQIGLFDRYFSHTHQANNASLFVCRWHYLSFSFCRFMIRSRSEIYKMPFVTRSF